MASGTIYDHPLYYDILFGWDRSEEAGFYHRIFERLGVPAGERVLEVACGTGRVARLLARRGWRVTGLDVRPAMLAFLRERAAAEDLRLETVCADMATYSTEETFAAACNPLRSFRLLRSDAAAEAHLHAMAAALRSGGVYVLDLELVARGDEPPITTDESWEMARGGVTVRADDEGVHVNDDGVELALAWGWEGHLRGYTAATFSGRVEAAREMRIESWHPESGRPGGVSRFSAEGSVTPPASGRVLVLRRS